MEQLSRAIAIAIITLLASCSVTSAQVQDKKWSNSDRGYLEPVYDPLAGSDHLTQNSSRRIVGPTYNDYEPETKSPPQTSSASPININVSDDRNKLVSNSSKSVTNSQGSTGFLSHLLNVKTNPDGTVHVKAPFLNIDTASGKVDVKLPLVNLKVNDHAINVKAPLVDVKTNNGAVDVKAPFVHVNH